MKKSTVAISKGLLAVAVVLLIGGEALSIGTSPLVQAFAKYGLEVDRSRSRNLDSWRPAIQRYSLRHYGEKEWHLRPTAIVLHLTAGPSFPWNLVTTTEFANESPGLASHYVVDGMKVWELLPPTIRSRGAYGINHKAINIEMVATDHVELFRRKTTLRSTARLTAALMRAFSIPSSKIYSHQQVALMDRKVVPEVLDLVSNKPYGKSDPGEKNMTVIREELRRL